MAQSDPIEPEKEKEEQEEEGQEKQEEKKEGSGKMYPSVEDVLYCCPGATVETLTNNLPYIYKEFIALGMVSPNIIAGMLGTVRAETTTFEPIPELGKGGGAYGVYYGRGYVQLTHDFNYKAAGEFFGVGDAWLENPEILLDPEIAAKVLAWWFDSGPDGIHRCVEACEAQDWLEVRRRVNGGTYGWEVYMETINLSLERITEPLQFDGVVPKPGTYGASDVDPGGAGIRSIVGTGMGSQGAVLLAALGLHARDSYTHQIQFECDVNREILSLEPQTTFDLTNAGKGLDGKYTVDEISYYPLGGNFRAIVRASRPDPNAPKPQIFVGDTSKGLGSTSTASGPVGGSKKIEGGIVLNAPYYKQKENQFNPDGSCNATSLAIAAEFLGIKPSSGRLADEIYQKLAAIGIPGDPSVMVMVMQEYVSIFHNGVATDDEIRAHLDKKLPVVIHGDFTESGHVICVIGYNSEGFIVHDPWFKYLGGKQYDYNSSGESNLHPYNTFVTEAWHRGGTNSAHFISPK
jgi:hypothetical protein